MFTMTACVDGQDPIQVKVTSRDVARWERAKSNRHLGIFDSAPKMADLEEMAFYALDRLGLYEGDLPTFRASVDLEDIERQGARAGDTGDENEGSDPRGLDPTRPGR